MQTDEFPRWLPPAVKIPGQRLHIIGCSCSSADNCPPRSFNFSIEESRAQGGQQGYPLSEIYTVYDQFYKLMEQIIQTGYKTASGIVYINSVHYGTAARKGHFLATLANESSTILNRMAI